MDPASTHAIVLDVLQRASSQNPDILKPAEKKLKEWEIQPGFYTVLFNIISNQTLDVNVRWMAVLYMKNGVDRYWRTNAQNGISQEEKHSIRQGLLSSFNESVNQIALQRAVLISKVARSDCPKEWPELLPTLLQAVESPDTVTQHRALLTLHHVVKAISSKRLAGDRRLFQDFTVNIYSYVLNLWGNFTEAFVRDIMQDSSPEAITVNLEKALLTLRVIRRLSIFGFYKPHEHQICMSFVKIIFEKAKIVLECRKQIRGKGIYLLELCEKFIVHLTKVLLSMLDFHPFSFIDIIQPSLEFTFYYLFTEEGYQFLFERFVIQCFNLIKNILQCAEYKGSKVDVSKQSESVRASQIKQNFFQPQITAEMCRKLVGYYFILTQDELDMWDSDPEAFANDECGDSWKYSLRPSMETVFVTLFHEYRNHSIPVILELISETNSLVPPEDMQGILKKDAVYNAVGLCAFALYDEVDFDTWFSNILLQELKIKHKNYIVIRRRITALMGRWAGIKLSSELRPALYECIIHLLAADEDIAVRLTAAITLRNAVDDFDFNPTQFKDYMFSAFSLLFNLLKESTECETKMVVLRVMTLMLERMGQTVVPHFDNLVLYLPHLWQESEEHNMLRCAIVSALVQVVKGLGGVKAELNQFLLTIIQLGTDTEQSAIVYLLEDCLELWLAVLEYSTTMSSELMQLFNNMPTLLEYSTENFKACMTICLAHLLLAPELVMRTQGSQIVNIFGGLIGDLKNEGVVMMLRLLETFIRAIPQLGTETVSPILIKIFEKIYEGEEYPYVMSMYLCLLARVLLTSHDIFTRMLGNLAQIKNENEQAVLSKILSVLLTKMPNVSQPDQRKLLGLALTNLLTTQSVPVMQNFRVIMVNILETLNDISTISKTDSLVLEAGQSPSLFDDENDYFYYETDHDQRKKQLILSDPVHTTILKDYVQSQIFELRNQLGFQQYEQLIQSLEADTIEQMKGYITF